MFTQFPKNIWQKITTEELERAGGQQNDDVPVAAVPVENAAKKPYKRRMTDKRREQNRAAQKAWREKQKKELEELKALRDAEQEKPVPPPAPPIHGPPFADLRAPHLEDGSTDMLALASIQHWGAVVGDDRARFAGLCPNGHHSGNILEIIEGDLPMNDDELLDAWAHIDYNEAPPVWPQGMGFPANFMTDGTMYADVAAAWTSAAFSASPDTIILTPAETASSSGSYAVFDFANQDPRSVMNGVPMKSTARSPQFVSTPENNFQSHSPPLSRQIRIHSISIHLACSANARIIGCTPEKALRTDFASPFYRPPTGPMPFSTAIDIMTGDEAEDTAWYEKGKTCGWKNIKKHLRPTEAQLVLPHNLWLDTLPFPTFRERFLRLFQTINGSELANDLAFLGGMVCWGGGHGAGAGAGTPWDVKSWEVKPWFVKKWWSSGVLGDDEGEVWEQCVWWAQFRNKDEESGELDDLMSLLG